jgi:hypothetical protein
VVGTADVLDNIAPLRADYNQQTSDGEPQVKIVNNRQQNAFRAVKLCQAPLLACGTAMGVVSSRNPTPFA